MSELPRILIISLSNIASDARVLKQVRYFAGTHRVVTCGFGPAPEGVERHISLEKHEAKPLVLFRAALIRAHMYTAAYWITPAVRAARKELRGERFDAILANDLDTAGLALAVAGGAPIHLDLHEYWLGLHDNNPAWVKLRKPFYTWQLRKHATQAASATSVSDVISQRYRDEFGIDSGVVANASTYQVIKPSEAREPLRLVHSGGSQPSRRIENMMRAVAASRNATLDLLLVGGGTAYYESLVALAEELGERIRILPPVRPDELVGVLNGYDAGLHVLPPTNTNNALALPNKFFDYVQARLALVIGPTASMADLLRQHDLGVVTDDFEVESLTRAIDSLTAEQVTRYKQHAHAVAEELSAEPQNAVWGRAIERLVGGGVRSADAGAGENAAGGEG
ncbi:glycosyltransferase [Leucobacter sp. GX24907]